MASTSKEAQFAPIKLVKLVSIPITDPERALEFYSKKLGFQVTTDAPFGEGKRWIELRTPGGETRVALFTPEGQENRVGSFSNVVFGSKDVNKAHNELRSRGVEFVQEPKTESWGTSAIFKDPDGNLLMISSLRDPRENSKQG